MTEYKGRIVKVGAFLGDGTPVLWEFDCQGMPGIIVSEDGQVSYCGWTLEELRYIAAVDE